MEKFEQILKYLLMKGIQFQYKTNIQNILIQDQSIGPKVNLRSQVEVKEMKEVNEAFVSENIEVHQLNMNRTVMHNLPYALHKRSLFLMIHIHILSMKIIDMKHHNEKIQE
jgi:hypothetical protein